MSRPAILIRKWVIFLAWFASGIVMMYCSFPRVEAEDRLSSAALDPAQIQIGPNRAQAAISAPAAPSQIRLNLLDGRPIGQSILRFVQTVSSGNSPGSTKERLMFPRRLAMWCRTRRVVRE